MITRVVVRVESTVSYEASVEWELSGGDISLTVSPGTELDTNQLVGATQISLQATLPGGGDSELFSSLRTEEKQPDTQLKMLVYPHLNPRFVTFSIKSVLSWWRMLAPFTFIVDSNTGPSSYICFSGFSGCLKITNSKFLQ